MALLRRVRRLTIFFLWMWPYGLWSLLHAVGGRAGIRRVAQCTRNWGRFLVRHVAPVEVTVSGEREVAPGSLIVSNHQSYIDILVHASLFPIRFAPKAEIRHWPVFGWYLAISRPVWVDRKSRQKSKAVMEEFRRTLEEGVSLLVYPEGTTTDGQHGLLPFKSTPFETVTGTNFTIQPILTRYEIGPDGWNPAWYGDQTLLPHVWKFLGRKKLRAEVTILPPLTARPGEDRKELAQRVADAMQQALREKSGASAGEDSNAAGRRPTAFQASVSDFGETRKAPPGV